MSGTHGRAGWSGRAWLGTALAASGWIAASGLNPAGACHISQIKKPAPAHVVPTPTPASASASATPPATSPKDDVDKAYQNFLNDWHKAVGTTPTKITPTLTTTAKPPAAQELVPITPTVANQGTSQPCGCPPPPPCPAPPSTTGSTPQAPQILTPAAGATNPTAAPEPSTVVSALAMLGAVAWRRRSARPRA